MKGEMIQIITRPFKWHLLSPPLFSHFKVCKYLGNLSLS